MTVPTISGVRLAGSPGLPLLVCGPSLGTSSRALWSSTAALLADTFDVVGWDLPGHGINRTPVTDGFTMAELAAGVLSFIDGVLTERGEPGRPFAWAGDSVGGAVGLQLLLDHPGRITTAILACTAARIGDEAAWRERADLVRTTGTPVMVEGSARRWFGPGFVEEQPAATAELLHALQGADRWGYAATCDALATFDVRAELFRIEAPVVALAGAYDTSVPVTAMATLAHGVADGRLVVLDRAAHLAPVEAPVETARIIVEAAGLAAAAASTDRAAAGMAVRRAVLGDEHVDRSIAATTDLTRDFQDFITEYAWGGVWTRPGLDRRSRSMITVTALVARGHLEELELHLRAARTNGLSDDEINEVLLQSAIYCGVPDANAAFRVAQRTLGRTTGEDET